METVAVTDLYQASYFLLSGCAITGIACAPGSGKHIQCTLYLSGQNLDGLKDNWFNRRAMVNLWAFRLAYAQIHSSIDEAKKDYFRNAAELPQDGFGPKGASVTRVDVVPRGDVL